MRGMVRCVLFVALFVLLAGLRVSSHVPALPSPLRIDLALDRGEAGRADPLIVAGRPVLGDLLTVRFLDERTIQFIYDSWGFPGIPSQPVVITVGETLRLAIEMPALTQVHGNLGSTENRVRVRCNDHTVLDATGHFYVREPERIFFGLNPIGGTACGPTLRGKITTPDGRMLNGGLEQCYTWRERFFDWGKNHPLQIAVLLLFSGGVALWIGCGAGMRGLVRSTIDLAVTHRWFVGSSLFATLGFTWIVTMGSFQFSYREVFGFFYDYQAATILQGRLDVPEDAIGGEGFEARGKLYGYFGPTPALLRIPFVLAGFAFGTMARAFMVGYFVACLLASHLIVRHALTLMRSTPESDAETAPLSPFAALCIVGSVGLGSTIFFLGSRSFMYHEAILAGITFALWSCWCSLEHLQKPTGRFWIGALACGVLSIHARPPTGLFALTVLGCIGAILAARTWRSRGEHAPAVLRRALVIGAASLLGVLSLNAVAWLKFRTLDPAPLRFSRAMLDRPGRLERVEGKSVHLANLPFNFDTYFVRPNLRLEPGFPWLYLISHRPRRSFPAAKMDLPDHTLAVPYAMPSLFALATLGCAGAALVFPRARVPIGVLWIAALPMSLALLAAVATAQRYTGDFVPFLICAAGFGLAAVENAGAGLRTLFRVLTGVATAVAMFVTIAITVHYQGETLWGVPEETRTRYQNLRRSIDAVFGHETPATTKK